MVGGIFVQFWGRTGGERGVLTDEAPARAMLVMTAHGRALLHGDLTAKET